MRIGALLRDAGVIDDQQLDTALQMHRASHERLGSTLIRLGYVDRDTVAMALARQKAVLPALTRHFDAMRGELATMLDRKTAERLCAVPVESRSTGREVVVALRDPADIKALDELAFATGRRVIPVAAPEICIRSAIATLHERGAQATAAEFSAARASAQLPAARVVTIAPVAPASPRAQPVRPSASLAKVLTSDELDRLRVRASADIIFGYDPEEVVLRLIGLGASADVARALVDAALGEHDQFSRRRGVIQAVAGVAVLLLTVLMYYSVGPGSRKLEIAGTEISESWWVSLPYVVGAVAGFALAATGATRLFLGGKSERPGA